MSIVRESERRTAPTASRPEVRVVVGGGQRLIGRLDHALEDAPPDPELAEVVAAARAHPGAESWMLAGGEPTLRKDLPKLVRALVEAGGPRVGLVTDGLALAGDKVPELLKGLGLARVRVRLTSARPDAHDWLVGQPGAWKKTIKAIRASVEAGLETEIECSVTRPTAPYLEEAIELFVKLGAKAVVLRRPTARGPLAGQDVSVAPRLALMARELEKAALLGARSGLVVMLEGFPRCVAPAAQAHLLLAGSVVWALPASGAWPFLRPRFEPPPFERGCATCPGDATCSGAPSDYTARFGRGEIESEGVRLVNPGTLPPTPLAGGEVYPPPRAGRAPPTRPAYARLAARLPSLGGDPLVAQARQVVPPSYRVVFLAPGRIADPVLGELPGPTAPEPTRDIRIRLVRVAQHGAPLLRVASAGSLWHPEIGDLLRETTRLQLPRVEVAGDVAALDRLSDMELRRLRGITRIEGALFGATAEAHDAIVGRPGAYDATLKALDRLGSLVPSLHVGVYAVLRDADGVAGFVEGWDRGDLPGAPRFRLAPRGGSLSALAQVARSVTNQDAREALAAVLPKSLFERPDHVIPAPEAETAWGEIPEAFARPGGSDVRGCYTGRLTSGGEPKAGDDPGFAVGWSVDL